MVACVLFPLLHAEKGCLSSFPVPFLDAMKAIGGLPSGGCKMRRQRDWETGPFLAPESIMKCLHD